MHMEFVDLMRQRGFHETLRVLYAEKNYQAMIPIFIEKLDEIGSYYNAFHRVKKDMLDSKIIEYMKNRDEDRCIRLTEIGVGIAKEVKAIETLFLMPYDAYNEMKKQKQKANRHRMRARMKKSSIIRK